MSTSTTTKAARPVWRPTTRVGVGGQPFKYPLERAFVEPDWRRFRGNLVEDVRGDRPVEGGGEKTDLPDTVLVFQAPGHARRHRIHAAPTVAYDADTFALERIERSGFHPLHVAG